MTLHPLLSSALVACFGLMLSACAAKPAQPQQASLDDSYQALRLLDANDVNSVFYQCDQGIGKIEVRYLPSQFAAVLVLAGNQHELKEQRAASGVWYSNGMYTFRGKGDHGWLEIGRRAAIECLAD